MPILPTRNDLGQRPTPNAPITNIQPVSVDLSSTQKGYQALASGMEQFGKGMMYVAENQDKDKYLAAKSTFIQRNTEIQRELENDPNYETYQDRYEAATKKAKEEAYQQAEIKGGFFGNRFKDQLDSELNLIKAQGYDHLANIATRKGIDRNRSELDDLLYKNSQSLFQTSDPAQRADILRTTHEAIDNKVALNAISQEDAVKLKRNFAESYASQRLVLLSPQEQIKALNPKKGKDGETYFEPSGSFVDIIDPKQKIVLLDRARNQLETDKNASVIASERAIRLRKVQAEENAFQHIVKGGKVSDITPQQWFLLDNGTRQNLETLEKQKAGLMQIDPIEGDRKFYEYQDLYVKNPQAFANISSSEIAKNVSPDKIDKVLDWRSKAAEGQVAPASLEKTNKIINSGLYGIGINPNSKAALPFKERFNKEITAFQELNGKTPTTKDLEDIKHNLITDIAVEGRLWGQDNKKLYQVKDSEISRIIVPESFKNRVLMVKKKNGLNTTTTEDEFRRLYLKEIGKNAN